MIVAFIGLSAIEIPVVDLLLPWESARRAFLALGAYGLFWMLGLLASLASTRTSSMPGVSASGTASPSTSRSRGTRSARSEPGRRSLPSGRSGKRQFEQAAVAVAAHIPVTSSTNIDVALRRPAAVLLSRGRSEAVTDSISTPTTPGPSLREPENI